MALIKVSESDSTYTINTLKIQLSNIEDVSLTLKYREAQVFVEESSTFILDLSSLVSIDDKDSDDIIMKF